MSNSFTPTSPATSPIAAKAQTNYTAIIATENPALNTGVATAVADPNNDHYAQGLIDAVCLGRGYIGQSDAQGLGLATYAGQAFADIGDGSTTGFSSWSFTPPLSAPHLINVDLSVYLTAVTGNGQVSFQLTVGANTAAASSWYVHDGRTGVHLRCSFRYPAPAAWFTGGSPVAISLQWKTDAATTTAAVNATSFRTFTATG